MSERKTLTPFVKMQKYMHSQIDILRLVVESALQCCSTGYCNYSQDIKRACGFYGMPSKFHRFSSIPLILAYNVYSQVN